MNSKISPAEEIYLETDDWLSALNFLSAEIRFLKKVMNNYLAGFESEITQRVEVCHKSLDQIELKSRLLKTEVLNYRESLNKGINERPALEERHKSLLKKYNDLNNLVRNFKDDLFDITEDVYGE